MNAQYPLINLFALLFFSLNVHGQNCWAVKAGGANYDGGNDISNDAAGNSYVTGYFAGVANFGSITLTNGGDDDIFLAKYDINGNCIWARKAGFSSFTGESGQSICTDAVGNSYVIGSFAGTASFGALTISSNNMSFDVFIAKYDSNGNCIWVQNGGSASNNGDYGQGISLDGQGTLIATGYFSSTATFGTYSLSSAGSYDVFIVKYDINGNCVWARKGGGTGVDIGNRVSSAANYYYMTGVFTGTMTIGSTTLISAGGEDIFVAKYDLLGTLVWAQRAGGASNDGGMAVGVDASGNSYVSGYFQNSATFGSLTITSLGQNDLFICKCNPSGNFAWVKRTGSSSSNEYGKDIAVDGLGNSYTTGDFYVREWNSNGNNTWTAGIGAVVGGLGSGLNLDSFSNVYVTGTFFSSATICSTTLTPNAWDVIISRIGNVSGTSEHNESNAISICPNPFSVETIIKTNGYFHNATLIVYNSWGQTVKKIDNISGEEIELSRDDLPPGVYIVQINNIEGNITRKILIQ